MVSILKRIRKSSLSGSLSSSAPRHESKSLHPEKSRNMFKQFHLRVVGRFRSRRGRPNCGGGAIQGGQVDCRHLAPLAISVRNIGYGATNTAYSSSKHVDNAGEIPRHLPRDL